MPDDDDRSAPFPRATKRPPPAHGIRVKTAGATWWGRRWLDALTELLRGHAPRLARGRTYARTGRVHDLSVRPGKVTAKVTGSTARPYTVTLALRPFTAAEWREAVDALAARAGFAADLLNGAMPEGIDEAFEAAGVSLFPRFRAELETACTCPDPTEPCKHVAATHTVLAEALDRDPFLLAELRGLNRDALLDALRAARRASADAGAAGAPAAKAPRVRRVRAREPAPPSVPLRARTGESYDRPRAPLPALHFTVDPTPGGVSEAWLAQLGTPAGWPAAPSPAELLGPHFRAAAEAARRLALGDDTEASRTDAADTAVTPGAIAEPTPTAARGAATASGGGARTRPAPSTTPLTHRLGPGAPGAPGDDDA